MKIRGIAALVLASGAALVVAATLIARWSPMADAFASFLPIAGVIALVAFLLGIRSSRTAVLIATLCIGICAWKVTHEIAQRESAPDNSGERLVIVTHNLLAINEHLDETLQALAASDADILLLQEAHGNVGERLAVLNSAFPYHSDCGGGCDLAIYSRLPIERPRWRLRDSHGEMYGPPLMWTIATLPSGRRFMAISIHQSWPYPPGEQQSERQLLVEALARAGRPSTILAGDFNLTPWTAGMAELDEGLIPMRRITRGLFSFPARLGSGSTWPAPLLPIDHIFAGPSWTVTSVDRLERTGSDHYPIRAELRLP